LSDPLKLGWEEWLSLPDLGLPAIRAKVDTGARTSALHATHLETFGKAGAERVRFIMHPDPDNPDLQIICSAKITDQREVTSSNGETEMRFVIQSKLRFGDVDWPIDITLTNRETMRYRMLLGRSAIPEHAVISPQSSLLQPVLDYSAYKNVAQKRPVKRPLRIALLTRAPDNYSSRRLIEAAEARGHVVDAIDTSRCYMAINARRPEVHYDGAALPRFDAVIPRIGVSTTFYGMAVLRQFEMMGTYCLNGSAAIGRSRDKLYAHQVLAQAGIDMPATAFASSPKDTGPLLGLAGNAPVVVKLLQSTQGKGVMLAETKKAAESLIDAFRGLDANFLVQEFIKEAGGADVRCFVIGTKVAGAMKRQAASGDFRSNLHRGGTAKKIRLTAAERKMAVQAARAMGLTVAGVDLLQTEEGPKILEVNSSPGLEGIEEATGTDLAARIIEKLEARTPTYSRNMR